MARKLAKSPAKVEKVREETSEPSEVAKVLKVLERGAKPQLPTEEEELREQMLSALESDLPGRMYSDFPEVAEKGRQATKEVLQTWDEADPGEPMSMERLEDIAVNTRDFVALIEEDCRLLEAGQEVSAERLRRRIELATRLVMHMPAYSRFYEAMVAYHRKKTDEGLDNLNKSAGNIRENINKANELASEIFQLQAKMRVIGITLNELTKKSGIGNHEGMAPGAKQETEQGTDVPELDTTIRPPESALDPAAEAERAILRAAELIAENPEAAQHVLPALGKLMQHVTDSPDVLTRKEVAEVVGLGPDRIKALTAEGRIGVLVGTQNLYSRQQVEDFKLIDRPPGRPKSEAIT